MALAVIMYHPSLFWGLGLDQNIFAEIGSLILKGKKPYIDAWDIKPPNIFYTYAFFEWIFGENSFAVRASDFIASMLAIAAVYFATRRLDAKSEFAPALASLLLALTLLSLGLADTAQTESYSLVLIIFGSALVINKAQNPVLRRSIFPLFAAGALIGLATFYKTTNAIFLLPIAIEIFLIQKKQSLRPIIFLLIGFFSCCLIEIGFLATQGNLREYLRISLSVLSNHANEVSGMSLSDIPRTIWIYVDIWSIVAIIAIFIAIARHDKQFLNSIRFPYLALCAGVLAVILQNKGWGYQYVVILPGLIPLIALSAVYLFKLVYNPRKQFRRGIAILSGIIVGIATLIATPSGRRRIHYFADASRSNHQHGEYQASLGSLRSLYYPAGTDSLASYIKSNSSANDGIFIFGEEPGAYWESNRHPASKYIYALLFTSGVIPDSDLMALNYSLIRKKPLLIVVERFDTLAFRGRPETSESIVMSDPIFAPMKEMLSTDYAIADTVCEKFVVYRRKM